MNINDLMGLLLAKAGVASAVNSLNLEWERWRWRVLRSRWLTRAIGWLLGKAVGAVAFLILAFTNAKQPAPPFLRSPFLKLSAAFDAWAIDILRRITFCRSSGTSWSPAWPLEWSRVPH